MHMHIYTYTLAMGDIPVNMLLNDIYYNDNEYHVLQRISQHQYDGMTVCY